MQVNYSKGKVKTLGTLEKYPAFLTTFQSPGSTYSVSEELFKNIQMYVCRLYGQNHTDDVNLARFNLFNCGQKSMPCTSDALLHTKRASYQVSIISSMHLEKCITICSISTASCWVWMEYKRRKA